MSVTDLSYCAGELRQHDRDRFLCTLFAPPERREALMGLFAFNLETARIGAIVSQPITGLIRVQWWRDALDGIEAGTPRAHPVVEALAASWPVLGPRRDLFDTLLDAREAEIEDRAPGTTAGFEAHLAATAGSLNGLALRALGIDEPHAEAAGQAAALAGGIVGHLGSIEAHAQQGRVLLPGDLLAEHGLGHDALIDGVSPEQLEPLRDAMRRRAGEHLGEARKHARRAPSAAMPVLLQITVTAARLRSGGQRSALLPVRLYLANLLGRP